MDPRTSRCVYRYLDLADRFVRVRVAGPRDLGIDPTGLDGKGYRRALVGACVEDLGGDLEARLEALAPGHPEDALKVLYGLVVAVNPELEIRNVSLREKSPRRDSAETSPRIAAERDAGLVVRRLRGRVDGLEERLGRRVFGQEDAVQRVARAARRAASGLGRGRGPLGTLLFLGPTGTGKTELARALADELGGPDALLRVDCGELSQGHETSRLIGAPPGYVGFESGGFLTEGMQRAHRAVVLFDEVEKAHPRLFDLLLSVLEEGEIVDGKGRTSSFRESFVILTSNAGERDAEAALERVGFAAGALSEQALDEIAQRALRRAFAPEFLGRVEDVVRFRALDARSARRVAERQLGELALRVRAAGHKLYWTAAVAHWIAAHGFDARSGARGMAGLVRRAIEGPLAERMCALPEDAQDAWLCVTLRGGRPSVRVGEEPRPLSGTRRRVGRGKRGRRAA